MKKILIVLATAWLAGCGDSDAGKPKDATAFFRPHMEKVYSAWSTLDASKPAMFYAKDPNLAFFDIEPLKYKGWQDYEDGFRKVAAGYKSLEITVAPDFHATQVGDVAWVTYTLDLAMQPQTGDLAGPRHRHPGEARRRVDDCSRTRLRAHGPGTAQGAAAQGKGRTAPQGEKASLRGIAHACRRKSATDHRHARPVASVSST